MHISELVSILYFLKLSAVKGSHCESLLTHYSLKKIRFATTDNHAVKVLGQKYQILSFSVFIRDVDFYVGVFRIDAKQKDKVHLLIRPVGPAMNVYFRL